MHVVRGIDPSSGRRPPAVGVIAVGQVAVGVVAVGQVALGAISVGQAAIGLGWGIGQARVRPARGRTGRGRAARRRRSDRARARTRSGWSTDTGGWVAIGWLIGGACCWRVAAAPAAAPPGARCSTRRRPTRDRVRARRARRTSRREVVSADQLRAPLSSRPCVFWHTVEVGPGDARHEHSGGEVDDRRRDRARRRIDFDSPVIFIRSDNYREIAGPDWALHLETSLARGETLHVAGPVTLTSDPSAAPLPRRRLAGVRGRPGAPLIVTTRNPLGLRTELRFAAAFAWTLVASGVLAAFSWALLL